MKFHSERLSANMERTKPEGFLLCRNVPVGRTGVLVYGPGETPVLVGLDGTARVTRDEEVCFEEASINSLAGKAVVNEHPYEDVISTNWNTWAKGTVLNPRRGTGDQSDLLLADLLIYDQSLIEDVLAGKREVSAGYNCDYNQTGDGTGRQSKIRYNHVALVDSGRCGQRCSIQDHAYTGDYTMKTLRERLSEAFRTGDSRAIDNELEKTRDEIREEEREKATKDAAEEREKEERKTKDEKMEERLKKTEDSLEEMKKTVDEGFASINGKLGDIAKASASSTGHTTDKGRKTKDGEEEDEEEEVDSETMDAAMKEEHEGADTKDAAFLAPTFQDTVAMAEIIAPGIKLPTYDSAATPVSVYRSICGLRRKALQAATQDAALAPVLSGIRGGRTVDSNELLKMPCNKVRDLFFTVGTVKGVMNTQSHSTSDTSYNPQSGGGMGVPGVMKTPADLNKRFAEIYK